MKYGFIGSEAIQLGKLLFLKSWTVGYNDVDYVFELIRTAFYGRRRYNKRGRKEFTRFLLRLKRRYGIYYQNRVVCFDCELNVNTQLSRASGKYYDLLLRRFNDPKLEAKRIKALRKLTNDAAFLKRRSRI